MPLEKKSRERSNCACCVLSLRLGACVLVFGVASLCEAGGGLWVWWGGACVSLSDVFVSLWVAVLLKLFQTPLVVLSFP